MNTVHSLSLFPIIFYVCFYHFLARLSVAHKSFLLITISPSSTCPPTGFILCFSLYNHIYQYINTKYLSVSLVRHIYKLWRLIIADTCNRQSTWVPKYRIAFFTPIERFLLSVINSPSTFTALGWVDRIFLCHNIHKSTSRGACEPPLVRGDLGISFYTTLVVLWRGIAWRARDGGAQGLQLIER